MQKLNVTEPNLRRLLLVSLLLCGILFCTVFYLRNDLDESDRKSTAVQEVLPKPSERLVVSPPDVAASNTGWVGSVARVASVSGSPGTLLEWRSLNIRSATLQDLLNAGLSTANGEEAATAVHLAALCGGLSSAPANLAEVSMRRGARVNFEAVTKAIERDHERLSKFCAGADVDGYLDRMAARALSVGPLLKQMYKTGDKQQSQEYLEAMVQVLSDPSKYSLAFDTWLGKNIGYAAGKDLTAEQLAFVHDGVYRRFVGKAFDGDLRALERCRVWFHCDGIYSLSDKEFLQAEASVNRVEMQIRERKWGSLISR